MMEFCSILTYWFGFICLHVAVNVFAGKTCDTREEGLKQRLERCHEKSDFFLKRYATYRIGRRGSRQMCRTYFDFRNCIGPIVDNCTNIREQFMQDWSAVDKIMQCACFNGTAVCKADLKCMRQQFTDPLVERCDIMYRFQRKQRIYDECGLLREAVLCRDRLVRTACGEDPGEAAFQLAKLGAVHPRHRLQCNVSSIDSYRGFTYSPLCKSNFTSHMVKCYNDHLRSKLTRFTEENDLIALGDEAQTKQACRNYLQFVSCMKSISDTCSEGIKLVYDMDGRWRTYLLKMDYICRENNEGYAENLHCLQKTIVNDTLRLCNPIWYDISAYFSHISAYQFYCKHNKNGTVPHKLYTGLQQLRHCYTDAFTGFCGNVTGRIMEGLMREVFHDPFYLRFRYKPRCNVNLRTTPPPVTYKTVVHTRTVTQTSNNAYILTNRGRCVRCQWNVFWILLIVSLIGLGADR